MLIHPVVDPVALAIGPIKIYWYGIGYVISFAIIWFLAVQRGKRLHPQWKKEQITDLIFYAALGVVIGGRVGEMLFYELHDFLVQPLLLFAIWHGGMSFHGGLLGVIVSIYVFVHHYKWKFWEVMDFIAPFVPIGLFLGRIGNFINSELVGRATNVAWAMIYPAVDELPRHPSQIYEALAEGMILFIILWFYSSRHKPRGAVSMLFLLSYGLLRFGCEFFREPDMPVLFGWLTRGQLLSLPMIIIGAGALLTICLKPKKLEC